MGKRASQTFGGSEPRRRLGVALAALALLLVTTAVFAPVTTVIARPAAGGNTEDEAAQQLREDLAEDLADLGDWCRKHDLNGEAARYAEMALALVPDFRDAVRLLDRLDGDRTDTDDERDLDRYANRLERKGDDIAELYCQLAALTLAIDTPEARAEVDRFAREAYGFDPAATIEFLDDAAERKLREPSSSTNATVNVLAAQRLLTLAQELEPNEDRADRLFDVDVQLAQAGPVLREAREHAMQYYFSLPADYSRDETWPIAVGAEGAGCNFLGYARGFVNARAERPFICVTPITFSNTNEINRSKYPYDDETIDGVTNRLSWDEAGLLAVLDDVVEIFGGESSIYITGFSGGGIITWTMVFRHPDMIVTAAPACGNYTPASTSGDVPEPPDPDVPIVAFQGDADNYLESVLNPQWAMCERAYTQLGYTNIKRVMVPGVGHSAMHGKVMRFFDQVRTDTYDGTNAGEPE